MQSLTWDTQYGARRDCGRELFARGTANSVDFYTHRFQGTQRENCRYDICRQDATNVTDVNIHQYDYYANWIIVCCDIYIVNAWERESGPESVVRLHHLIRHPHSQMQHTTWLRAGHLWACCLAKVRRFTRNLKTCERFHGNPHAST